MYLKHSYHHVFNFFESPYVSITAIFISPISLTFRANQIFSSDIYKDKENTYIYLKTCEFDN